MSRRVLFPYEWFALPSRAARHPSFQSRFTSHSMICTGEAKKSARSSQAAQAPRSFADDRGRLAAVATEQGVLRTERQCPPVFHSVLGPQSSDAVRRGLSAED
jgi:hypothetical protein